MKYDFKLFIDQWQNTARIGAEIFVGLTFIIIVSYFVGLLIKVNPTKKYKFMSKNETRFFWYAALSLTLSFTFLLNSLIIHRLNTYQYFELILKTVLSLGLGFAIGSFFNTYIKVYYQFTLDERLANIRFKPRKSSSGNTMKLLNEEEEDTYMTAEMIAHEESYTFDYDIWIDKETGEILTEKYDGNLHSLICNNCKFRTLKIVNEEIEKSATVTTPGSIKKYLKCAHCNREDIMYFEMPQLNS